MISVKVDRRDPTDLYEQVAAEIRRAIADGEAKPGERLPPAKDLAAILGVNTNTVLRSLRDAPRRGTARVPARARHLGRRDARTRRRRPTSKGARRASPAARATASTSSSRSSKTSADNARRAWHWRGTVQPGAYAGRSTCSCRLSTASGSRNRCRTPRSSSMSRAATSPPPTSSRNDFAGSSSRSDALYAASLKMTEAAPWAHDWRGPVFRNDP